MTDNKRRCQPALAYATLVRFFIAMHCSQSLEYFVQYSVEYFVEYSVEYLVEKLYIQRDADCCASIPIGRGELGEKYGAS